MVPEALGIGSSLNVFPCLDSSYGYLSGEPREYCAWAN